MFLQRQAARAARFAQIRLGLLVLAAICVGATWSFSVPVGPFLMAFCAAAPRRWFVYALTADLATALAAVALVAALASGFAPWIAAQVPGLTLSPEWLQLHAWVDRWGLMAMLVWLALPLPQVPFVVLAGLLGVPSWEVFTAFAAGKGIKYAVEAYVAARAARAAGTLAIQPSSGSRSGGRP